MERSLHCFRSLFIGSGHWTRGYGGRYNSSVRPLWRRQLRREVATSGYFADGVLLTPLEFFLGATTFFIAVRFCASRFQHLRVLPPVFFSRRSRWSLPYQGHPGGCLHCTHMVPKPGSSGCVHAVQNVSAGHTRTTS